ncbi:MAG: SixA phosphatase family protein [Acidimicrobiales bacterium]
MALLLVRHAHAWPRKEWPGEERLRPLSPNGLREAEGLVSIAGSFPAPLRVLSSPYERCVQTVAPLAARYGLLVETADELAEGHSDKAVKLVRSLAGQDVVVCTHGDVIAEVLVSIADEDRVDLGPNPRQAKGSAWALQGRNGRFKSAKYFPPVAAEAV